MAIGVNLRPGRSAALIGLGIFTLLWTLNLPYRRVYQPSDNDVTTLADALLLVPGAHWQEWFTKGYTDFFESYPEWPHQHLTAFARPAFQFLVYLAHFIFGQEWSSYLVLNYLAIAGVAGVAFVIARTTLSLEAAASVLAAGLVSMSPAVLESSIWEIGFASESVAVFLVGCAFLAVVAARDFLCVIFLSIAVLTKETAIWAPFAAVMSVLLRADSGQVLWRRARIAAGMLLPIALWLGLRFAFFGGLGGTYATIEYTPLAGFLGLTLTKLLHLYQLFVSQAPLSLADDWQGVDRVSRIGTGLLVLLFLILWILKRLRAASGALRLSQRTSQWSTAKADALVTLWAATGLAFYLALALHDARYSASAVMFAWPAMVREIARDRIPGLRLGLVICGILSVVRASTLLFDLNPPAEQSQMGRSFRAADAMSAALRRVPAGIGQVYVLTSGSLGWDNPEYVRAFLKLPAEIIRVAEIQWDCEDLNAVASIDHESNDGFVTLTATLPKCAHFFLSLSGIDASALVDGRLRRGLAISYEMPNAFPPAVPGTSRPTFDPPQRMIVHIRPRGRARFLIEHGVPDGGVAWFDAP
jgi:hypothetical protein